MEKWRVFFADVSGIFNINARSDSLSKTLFFFLLLLSQLKILGPFKQEKNKRLMVKRREKEKITKLSKKLREHGKKVTKSMRKECPEVSWRAALRCMLEIKSVCQPLSFYFFIPKHKKQAEDNQKSKRLLTSPFRSSSLSVSMRASLPVFWWERCCCAG